MKKQTSAEYTSRVRKILKSKLNGGNTIQAINNWAVPVIRYTAGIVDRTIAELEDLDHKTRKLMTAHRTLHPQSDIDRPYPYLPRRIGGRGLLQIRQKIEEEIRNLSKYISSSTESALKQVITEGLLTVEDTKKEYKRKEMRNRQERWQNKSLHGQYPNDTDGKTDFEIICNWLKNGYLKKETEGFIMAAQYQAIRTNAIKARIDKTSSNSKCRLCR